MESRLIYLLGNSVNCKWQINNEHEWIHIGIDEELNKEKVIKQIDKILKGENFFIVLGRTNSKEMNKSELEKEVFSRIGKENFRLSDLKFEKIIEFNNIGIMRVGTR